MVGGAQSGVVCCVRLGFFWVEFDRTWIGKLTELGWYEGQFWGDGGRGAEHAGFDGRHVYFDGVSQDLGSLRWCVLAVDVPANLLKRELQMINVIQLNEASIVASLLLRGLFPNTLKQLLSKDMRIKSGVKRSPA